MNWAVEMSSLQVWQMLPPEDEMVGAVLVLLLGEPKELLSRVSMMIMCKYGKKRFVEWMGGH